MKHIPIGNSAAAIDPPTITDIVYLNGSPLIHGYDPPLSTSQAHYFGMIVHDYDKHHSGKYYIYADYQVTLMKFTRPLFTRPCCMWLFLPLPNGGSMT